VEEQTDQAISNVEAILEAGGCQLSDVTKVVVYLTDLKNFSAMNGVYAKRFAQPYPVRSIIQTALPAAGAFVALDAIALRPEGY
jgi:2-iminobutanoate/2-iminopropanoate deaminase